MPVVNLSAGDLIDIDDYNSLAKEINRLFSNEAGSKTYSTSDLILDITASAGGEAPGKVYQMTATPASTDFIVVAQNDLTLIETSGWTKGDGRMLTAIISSAGSGYSAFDKLTVVGGIYESVAIINVDTVDGGGAITGVSIDTAGLGYSLFPTVPFSVTSVSSGTGATFAATYDHLDNITFVGAIPASATIKIYNRTTHRYGMGQTASVHPITAGDPVLADEAVLQAYLEANINNIIDKTNIMLDRTSSAVELTRIAPAALIYAADKNLIATTIENELLSGTNYWDNDIATVTPAASSFVRVADWATQLVGVFRWTFSSYSSMRYFFNSGSEIRCNIAMTGDKQDAGYFNWNQVATAMGSLILNYDTSSQTGTSGTTTNIGAYELTSTYQTIYTSGSPPTPVDGDGPSPGVPGTYTAYGTYSNLVIKFEAILQENVPAAGNVSVDIRVTMDDSSFLSQDISGTTTLNAGYKLADGITDNSAVFSTSAPTILVVENFTSGNDS